MPWRSTSPSALSVALELAAISVITAANLAFQALDGSSLLGSSAHIAMPRALALS